MGLPTQISYAYVTVQANTNGSRYQNSGYDEVWICSINMAATQGRKLETNICFFGLHTSAWSTLPDQLLFLLK